MSEASAPLPRARGGGRGRGQSRGRGRGGGGNSQAPDSRTGDDAPSKGGRRGGRNPNRGGLGLDGNPITTPAATRDGSAQAKLRRQKADDEKPDAEDVEAEVCFICASPVMHNSVAPCNHRTCHICALRMRALYKTKDCAHCRTPAPFVVFTDDASKRYEDFSNTDITFTDNNNGIRYESNEIMEDTVLLLRYNCPDGDCDVACLGWPDLHRHVRALHHEKICDLCSRHKKVFTHEHELFTDQELTKHMRKGDDNPGAVDQSGFKGHPECGFCRQRFYGDDELYVHCREKHERCFICDRRGGQPQYFVDYHSLEKHFGKDHHPCLERSCLDKKFVVFPSEMDLKAHQLEEHGDTLSKDVRRDARVVDLSSFDYRAPYIQERRGGSQREQREARGRGRGRDPNAEPIPASSAQPLPRDQQAFQRQMAIHSAQSVSTRNFGGQLTPTPTPPARVSQPPATSISRPSSSAAERATSALEGLDLADLTPQDQARQLRHREVIERASTLLQNDASKVKRFRTLVSSYQSSSIDAQALVESLFSVFSDSSNSTSTLVREVADLFEDKRKADDLRTALNDWRAINEDYPSLPDALASSGTLPLNWATTTGSSSSTNTNSGTKSNRVLKLKSSTAQSSRSSVSKTRSWGGSATVAPTTSNRFAFPDLPSSSRPQSSKVTTVPWTQSSSTPSSNPNSAPTSRPGSTAPGSSRSGARMASDAFPSLPTAQKPQMTLFGYGNGRAVIRDPGKQTSSSAWGGEPASSQQDEDNRAEDGEEGGKGKKKGNKGKKQVLMNWG